MANNYLKSKWRMWFEWFDHNKDGKVCYADLESARKKFTQLHHFEGDEKKRENDAFTKWWSEYILWGRSELTVDEFVQLMDEAFKADQEKFKAKIQKCEYAIGDFMAASEKGYLTEEDVLIMFKAGGHANVELDRKFFATFNPVDGKVPLRSLGRVPDQCGQFYARFGATSILGWFIRAFDLLQQTLIKYNLFNIYSYFEDL